jgi:DNA-binding IclR family transcriptional regulator
MPVRLFIHVGQVLHLHSNAAGKILLARKSDREIQEVIDTEGLPSLTSNTITEPERLFQELEKVKDTGYALCNGEGYWDAGSVGGPVRDFTGEVIASVTIYGPLSRYQGEA